MTSSTEVEKTTIVIVSKSGSLSECVIETNKETTLEELTKILSKKCGNLKSDDFSCYHTYKYKPKNKSKKMADGGKGKGKVDGKGNGGSIVYIDVWSKTNGRAGQENKYELPPPIDEIIFFGNIALVARVDKETACDLSIDLWSKIYEKLFGGFEDLAATARDDDNEVDEIAFFHPSRITANGYLKDGFVVDDSGSSYSDESDHETKKKKKKLSKSDTTTESEFITDTETETDSISDSELQSSESSNDCRNEVETKGKSAGKGKSVGKRAGAGAGEVKGASAGTGTGTGTGKNTTSTTKSNPDKPNPKMTPSIKKAPVKRKTAAKNDDCAASVETSLTSAANSAILNDKSDSELDEEAYSQ
jgi:hypothetical protein